MKKSNYKFVILFVICLCGLNNIYGQYQMSPLAGQIMEHFGISQVQFSSLFTAPMLPAIFLGIPFGMMADKYGEKKWMFLFLLIGALGLWGRVLAPTYAFFYACIFMMGFPATFINVTHAKILRSWFDERSSGIAVGAYAAMSSCGMAIGMGTTALFPSMRIAYIVSAAACTIVAVVWLLLMKEKNVQITEVMPHSGVVKRGGIGALLRNRNIILACFAIMLAFGCNLVYSTFLPTILSGKGMSEVRAGAVSSILMIGNLIGCLLIPVLIDRVRTVRPVIFVSAILMAILTVIVTRMGVDGFLINVVLLLAGVCLGGMVPIFMSFPIRDRNVSNAQIATACSLIATFQLFGAVVLPSYVAAPIAGDNQDMLLIIAAVFMVIASVLSLLMTKAVEPEIKRK